jgi:hypothetical protein
VAGWVAAIFDVAGGSLEHDQIIAAN